MNKVISIVEDEDDIIELVKLNLEQDNFKVKGFNEGEIFFNWLKNEIPSLIILDILLPGIDGIEICKKVRNNTKTSNIPIIMLTAKDTEVDRILGLEIGADDYITKPFSPRELTARVKAILRRSSDKRKEKQTEESRITYQGLEIDSDKYQVIVDGSQVSLTTTEFKILKSMVSKPGYVFSRNQLIDKVWSHETFITDRTIDVHITQIRKKIGVYGKKIKSVRGVGYKFEEDRE